MRNIIWRSSLVGMLVAALLTASFAYAMSPTLNVSSTGSGDQVLVTVNGDPNSAVILYYRNANYGQQATQTLGTTNSGGYFSGVISTSGYAISPGNYVYASVNGQSSNSVLWPNINNYPRVNVPTANQNSVSLTIGQSIDVPLYGGLTPYTAYASSPNIVQATLNGSTLHLVGIGIGSTTVNVCSYGNSSSCAVEYVNVASNGIYGSGTPAQITFSQSNVSLGIGQSTTVTISSSNYPYYYGGSGYYVAYNSSSNGLQASISGSSLYLYGSVSGSYAVVVCSSSNACSAVNVLVGGTSYGGGGNWYPCASENGFCSFPGTQTVRYGANGAYYYRTVTNGTPCSNNAFGDPIFGVVKSCWYGGQYGQ